MNWRFSRLTSFTNFTIDLRSYPWSAYCEWALMQK